MSDRSDSLLERLSEIDPARTDPGPVEGSHRYHSILEAAMSTAQDLGSTAPTHVRSAAHRAARPHWRRRLAYAAAAAAVVAAVAVAIVLTQPQHALTPEAALAAAATNLGNATTLRATMVEQDVSCGQSGELNTSVWTNTIEVDGDYLQMTAGETPPGYSSPEYSSIIMGEGLMWGIQADGAASKLTYLEETRLAPLTEAAKTFLEAALADANVVEIASEEIRDLPATHYRLDQVGTLDESSPLAQLPTSVLGWFGLERAGTANGRMTVDVWVSDEVIVRYAIDEISENPDDAAPDDWLTNNPGDFRITTTFDLYDYGADVHVEPPSGS